MPSSDYRKCVLVACLALAKAGSMLETNREYLTQWDVVATTLQNILVHPNEDVRNLFITRPEGTDEVLTKPKDLLARELIADLFPTLDETSSNYGSVLSDYTLVRFHALNEILNGG